MSAADRRAMLDRGHAQLSMRRQCTLLGLPRSGVYRTKPEHDADELALMRRIDAVFVARPFYGSRRIAVDLERGRGEGESQAGAAADAVDGDRRAGAEATHQQSRRLGTRFTHICCGIVAIERANQVWCADITYIPMRRGFLYLVAVMDWWSRAVLSWRLSNTMDAGFCVAALEEALRRTAGRRCSIPTRAANSPARPLSARCSGLGYAVSMDGRGRWMDNVFIERLWRSLKHEEVYLKDYADVREARAGYRRVD